MKICCKYSSLALILSTVNFIYFLRLYQPEVPIDKIDNNKLLKIPLRIKVFGWVILTKGILWSETSTVLRNTFLLLRWDNKAFILPILFCQIYMASDPISFDLISDTQCCQYFLKIGLMTLIIGLEIILGWERLL
jgi:hypothetical protein